MSDDATASDETLADEELRVAVVMNGGVSLAVWMGGITQELDRLRCGDGPYGALGRLTRSVPRIDVIAGSSAGGINGAILAVAIARGARVDLIRDVWMNDGSIEDLLRDPLRRDAPSLFRGDERFLERLNVAVEEVAKQGDGSPEHPLHLTITGTTLQGEVKAYADHFGAVIPDVDHRALFQFRRGRVGEVPEGDEAPDVLPWPDNFEGAVALAQLSLAARSSASFPVAFEPSFCRVGETDAAGEADPTHPNMGGVASFLQTRWVIDGGVLVNTPFRPALDAIATLPADRPVRRVLAYVVPNPVETNPQPDKRAALPPALTVAMDAGSRLPRVQSIGRELEEISANNKRVRKRRRSRACTLEDFDPSKLEAAAHALLPSYRCVRREAAAAQIIDLLLAGRRERDIAEWEREAPSTATRPRIEPWRRGPPVAQVEDVRRRLGELKGPWLMPDEQQIDEATPGTARSAAPWSAMPLVPWYWGIAPVEHAGNVVLDVLRSAISLGELGERRGDIEALRTDLHKRLGELRRLERHSDEYWRNQHHVLSDPRAIEEAVVGWAELAGEARPIALALAELLNAAWERIGWDVPGTDAAQLRNRLMTLTSTNGDAQTELTLSRLLALDVVQRSSGAELSGIEQEIELVLMSADRGPSSIGAEMRLFG